MLKSRQHLVAEDESPLNKGDGYKWLDEKEAHVVAEDESPLNKGDHCLRSYCLASSRVAEDESPLNKGDTSLFVSFGNWSSRRGRKSPEQG